MHGYDVTHLLSRNSCLMAPVHTHENAVVTDEGNSLAQIHSHGSVIENTALL